MIIDEYTIESLMHNKTFLSGLCGLSAFAVIILVWTALLEKDPLSARLKNIANRKSELRNTERQKKMTRHTLVSRVNVMKQIAQKLKLEQGKKD